MTNALRAGRLIEPLDMRIEYRDGKGQKLYRDITLKGVEEVRPGVFYLDAYCHLRKQPRTFRTDRIISIITRDGVVREPRELVETLDVRFAEQAPADPSANFYRRLALYLFAFSAVLWAIVLII